MGDEELGEPKQVPRMWCKKERERLLNNSRIVQILCVLGDLVEELEDRLDTELGELPVGGYGLVCAELQGGRCDHGVEVGISPCGIPRERSRTCENGRHQGENPGSGNYSREFGVQAFSGFDGHPVTFEFQVELQQGGGWDEDVGSEFDVENVLGGFLAPRVTLVQVRYQDDRVKDSHGNQLAAYRARTP